jgi:cardiolipin synthase A/B
LSAATVGLTIHILLIFAVLVRVLLRPYREPASRMAWILVVLLLPVLGIVAYLLFGEVNIGRRRVARMHSVIDSLPESTGDPATRLAAVSTTVPEIYQPLFNVGHSISGFKPVSGNSARLLADSNAAIDAMVADIDAAKEQVHLLFYIWLADNNGCKMVEALKRAAARGVTCRAMADALGSRLMIKSEHWHDMRNAGVHLAVALPIGNILLRPFVGRIDLRNHRKILVIDGDITYCGSQNCADPEFRVKPKYAPWVDAMMRFEGPVARQNQYLFASDWMSHVHEDIRELLRAPVTTGPGGFVAQVIGTGPTVRFSAMPEMFESLMHAARHTLVISTPYFVPSESMMDALCAAAYRGVDTTIIFPAVNDSWIVAAASRSYYAQLLQAGVSIYEYAPGLLHTKSLTLDGEVSLLGSANMDRRSFDLNYENNILLADRQMTSALRQRQEQYLALSTRVCAQQVANWSSAQRLWNNTIAMFGPVL